MPTNKQRYKQITIISNSRRGNEFILNMKQKNKRKPTTNTPLKSFKQNQHTHYYSYMSMLRVFLRQEYLQFQFQF